MAPLIVFDPLITMDWSSSWGFCLFFHLFVDPKTSFGFLKFISLLSHEKKNHYLLCRVLLWIIPLILKEYTNVFFSNIVNDYATYMIKSVRKWSYAWCCMSSEYVRWGYQQLMVNMSISFISDLSLNLLKQSFNGANPKLNLIFFEC